MKAEEKLPEIRLKDMPPDLHRRLGIWKANHRGNHNREILIALLERFLDREGIK